MNTPSRLASVSGPICLVTGGSSGIGLGTAQALSSVAQRIGLICRDERRGEAARDAIRRANPAAAPIDVWVADLASFASVRNIASSIRAAYSRVDVLVNNAGAVFSKRSISEDGLEMHLATNYAGHFLLTTLLIEELTRSKRPRVVSLTSSLHRLGRLRLDDLAFARPYHLVFSYAQSKLAGVVFTLELARRARGTPILTHCVDPGFVRTGIYRGANGHQRWLARRCESFGRDPTDTGVLIARIIAQAERQGLSGRYWTPSGERPLARRARDAATAEALWSKSLSWLSTAESERLESALTGREMARGRYLSAGISTKS